MTPSCLGLRWPRIKQVKAKSMNCSHCGGEIREDAKFCRHCGSSDSDGWSDAAMHGSDEESDLDDFDYESYVASEFGDGSKATSTPWHWQLIALMLLTMFFLGLLFF